MIGTIPAVLTLCLATPMPLTAQGVANSSGASAQLFEAPDGWRADHGSAWRVHRDADTGFARFVYGASLAPSSTPANDAEWFALGRQALALSSGLHGVDPAQLVEQGVKLVPLGLAGTTDKVAVRFRQELRGVPVVRGGLSVLAATDGRVLAIEIAGLPGLDGLDVEPGLSAEEARTAAGRRFQSDTGLVATSFGEPRLVVDRAPGGAGVLAWEVRAERLDPGSEPHGHVYRVDAHTAALTSVEDTVHHFDVSGTVSSFVTPGTLPDTAANPEVLLPLSGLRVDSSQGSAVTDANGDFTIVGATPPLALTVGYDGPFAVSENLSGADYSLVVNANQSTGNAITMNPAAQAAVTSQANAFRWANSTREWVKFLDPLDTTPDFQARARVQWNATCAAFFAGSATQFARAMGGCNDLAFSTVVVHELGHWYNERYGTLNGSDGMGEGAADVWAMYVADTPIVGENYMTSGGSVRTGLNTVQYWGDGNACPLGSSHSCGQVLMGAFWKMLANLRATHGTVAGRSAAGALFLGWNNAFDQTAIEDAIVLQLLALDDDDGDLANGTPNLDDIVAGFTAHGFTGFEPVAETYCTGKTSSAGCVPFVSFAGSPSVSASSAFPVTANDVVPTESGFLLYSFKKANLDFHGGKLCVKAPIVRTPAKAAKNPGGGCSGWTLRRNFNATIQSGLDPALTAGALVHTQWRQRDPADPAGFGDSLSDGLRFAIAP